MEKNPYLKPEISVLLLQTENVLQNVQASPIEGGGFDPIKEAEPEDESY